jgi:ribosome maturation factor RimP
MTGEAEVAARVEGLLEGPIADLGYRLLEVQFRHENRWVLRLVVDRKVAPGAGPGEESVSLDDCGEISELAGRLLDVTDPVTQAYVLEVSSPGMFRPLREQKHFAQSVGKTVRLTLTAEFAPERRNRTVRGMIESVGEASVNLALDQERLTVPIQDIRSARLDPDV